MPKRIYFRWESLLEATELYMPIRIHLKREHLLQGTKLLNLRVGLGV
jgi:hypothetical protein